MVIGSSSQTKAWVWFIVFYLLYHHLSFDVDDVDGVDGGCNDMLEIINNLKLRQIFPGIFPHLNNDYDKW